MGLGEDLVATSREATTSVTAPDLPALGAGGKPALAPLVHGVARIVVHRDDEGRIAEQPAHRLEADKPTLLEIARQAGGDAFGVDEGLQGRVEHGEIGTVREERPCSSRLFRFPVSFF